METVRFEELNITEPILRAITDMGFEEATPIQAKAIPIELTGADVVGQAQTGTGKTAAFGIPLLQKIDPRSKKLQAIVLCPTRELAIQVADEIRQLAKYMHGIKVLPIYGGQDIVKQIRSLKVGTQIIIGTPGRVMDHMRRKTVKFDYIHTVILDEADEMLNMGFREDIETILSQVPEERQTIMFSATMPAKIQQLANTILHDPAEVKLAVSRPADKIIQAAYVCYENQKLGIIRSLFAEQTPERVIIFASSKLKVKEVAKALKLMKLNVGEMHSDLEQAQREEVMHEFKVGRVNILVATDIVARGIDIDDIRLVINYDVPHDSEDYVHRIGRTARANNDGVALTFVNEKEQGKFKQIENFLEKDIYKIALPEELGEAPEYSPRNNDGKKRRNAHGKGNGRKNNKSGGNGQKRGNASKRKNGNAPEKNNS